MSALGPCTECGTELASDQRYCVECGHRVEAPLAPSYLPSGVPPVVRRSGGGWPLPIPMSMAGTFAALALGFGVIAGTAISPNLSNLVAGEYYGDGAEVAQAPPKDEKPAKKGGKRKRGGGGGGSGTTSSGFGTGFGSGSGFFGSSGSFGGGFGRGFTPAPAPEPKPVFVTGTVVANNRVAGSYTVSDQGQLATVHTTTSPGMPVPGSKVKVPIRLLANGTYAEDGKREVTGTTNKAKVRGTVTFTLDSTDPTIPDTYTLSGRGASMIIRPPLDPGTIAPPRVGSVVTTRVRIQTTETPPPPSVPPEYGCATPLYPFPKPPVAPVRELHQIPKEPSMEEKRVEAATISTIVQATCNTPPRQYLLSSEAINQTRINIAPFEGQGADVTIVVAGEPILARVVLDPKRNRLTEVTGTAGDRGIKGADDSAKIVGDMSTTPTTGTSGDTDATVGAARPSTP